MSTVNRGRGRPRKASGSEGFDLASVPDAWSLMPRFPTAPFFMELPDVDIDAHHLAGELREFVKRRPGLRGYGVAAMRDYMGAAADALEHGDAARVAWYMAHAVMCAQAATWHEELEVAGVGKKSGRALAAIGAEKLRADKRKGRRGKTL